MTTYSFLGTHRNSMLLNTISLSLVILTCLIVASSVAAAQNPSFTVNASPETLCVNPGITGRTGISVSSVGGFSGTVLISDTISPTVTNGPSLSPIPATVNLASGQTVSFNLDASTSTSTPTGTYTVIIAGLSGTIHDQAQFTLVVSDDCSVGGITIPTGVQASTSSSLALGIALAGIIAIVGAGLTLYLTKSRRRADQVPFQGSIL